MPGPADRFHGGVAQMRTSRVAGHVVFPKQSASSEHFMRYRHEQAYLLAKG
jgi:hypothetical protein